MSSDIECPYCGKEQEINHDDGYGYKENEMHSQECTDCDKTFTFTTSIIYFYESFKADCLNGGEHKWKPTKTFPTNSTRMKCTSCEWERPCTEEEMKQVLEGNNR